MQLDRSPEVFPTPTTTQEETKKRRRVSKEEGTPFSFHRYIHPQHLQFRLFDHNKNDITSMVDMHIKADKNVQYSPTDGAFLHYKQNHFQITTECPIAEGNMKFYVLSTPSTLQLVESLYIDVYAIKTTKKGITYDEEVTVPLCQTGKTRTKGDNFPAEPCILQNGVAIHSRLRFQSSTANNARTKNNEPNPNQEYFKIVVTLKALSNSTMYQIMAMISDPLIVRGQNPGRYGGNTKAKATSASVISPQTPLIPQPSVPVLDQKGNSYNFQGNVGIFTNNPQEALHVNGNALVTGNILKPRIKENFSSVDTAQQLRNIENLKIYDYDLKQWTDKAERRRERGVIAQELAEIIPEAVTKLGDVQTADGKVIQNLLVVNERVLLFENVGAIQELSKILKDECGTVNALDHRVGQLEHSPLSDPEAHGKLEEVIDFITSEEYQVDNDEGQCCYYSLCGLGPAWTTFISGFFLPILWAPGIFYMCSKQWIRRYAGLGSLIAGILYLIVNILFGIFVQEIRALAGISAVSWLCGICFLVVLGNNVRKKWRKRQVAKARLREYLGVRPREFVMSPKLYTYQNKNYAVAYPPTPVTQAAPKSEQV